MGFSNISPASLPLVEFGEWECLLGTVRELAPVGASLTLVNLDREERTRGKEERNLYFVSPFLPPWSFLPHY